MIDRAEQTSFLSLRDCLKATPAEEGGERFVYLEASNEARDHQGEVVLAKALKDSADYYLRYGNLDLDHITQLGPKAGIPNYPTFEIGRPAEVRITGGRTFVKGQVYRGEGPVAAKANDFWDSLTKISPPQRWYPSVGGAVVAKDTELDPKTKGRRTVIRQVRWTNIGFSKTPVNLSVPSVSTVPIGALAKSWGPGGLDLTKALEVSGGGTDAAALTGGAALAKQSLDRRVHSYWDFRDRVAEAVWRGRVHLHPRDVVAHATHEHGIGPAEASEWCERFLADLKRGEITKRKN
ncbi:hypothetical protein KPL78_04215 [Roseomonas sp. HJA6]|uniref:Uncharacterized protein n=1 Tax=Roseomonas alba TaxID=2846776 RepID=A0ABS7A5L6_9PROT|nr:hypothetical protein [Neoroseomonas alba]MBW6397037.1 hypothetical protein [Neoroseomonas alba]